jgi:hypothetical protein
MSISGVVSDTKFLLLLTVFVGHPIIMGGFVLFSNTECIMLALQVELFPIFEVYSVPHIKKSSRILVVGILCGQMPV